MNNIILACKQITGTLSRVHAKHPRWERATLCDLMIGPNWRETDSNVSCRKCLKLMINQNIKV